MISSTVLDFNDLLQERITALYATKFHIDEAERLTKKGNNDQSLDIQPLFIQLAAKHDVIRSMDFSNILSKRWQEEVTETLRALDIRQFYNIYQLIKNTGFICLDDFVAEAIVNDVVRPIQIFDENNSPKGTLNHCAIKDIKEKRILESSENAILTIRPHLTMLYMLSIRETILPGAK